MERILIGPRVDVALELSGALDNVIQSLGWNFYIIRVRGLFISLDVEGYFIYFPLPLHKSF